MELEINTSQLNLPKEVHFKDVISMSLETTQSISVLKREIFNKIKDQVVMIIPLVKKDFKLERKLSIKNGVITEEDEQVIDEFLEDVAKMDLHKFGIETISKAFEKPCVRYECKDPIEEVKKDIITWFETYLATLDWNLD